MNKQTTLNDSWVKLLIIPLLGLILPNLTGLISNQLYSGPEILLHYSSFTLIVYIIWEGNVQLLYWVLRRFQWGYRKMVRNIVVISILTMIYSALAAFVLLRCWLLVSREAVGQWHPLLNTCILIVVSASFVTNIYEIILLNREAEYNQTRVEQLNLAKAQAELEALKNQIDPHFIFNALNTLSFLISKNALDAKLYNDTLAKVYRYILGNKDKDLVLLKEELEFISNYFYLLKIRFGDAIHMVIEIDDLESEQFLIPPISLQMLVENAIKHNQFSPATPLTIEVAISSNFIIVRNQVKALRRKSGGAGIGLSNLRNRYRLITQKNIIVETTPRQFSIRLPVLKFQVP